MWLDRDWQLVKIDKIYKKYGIPTNLQRHMLTVAAVAELICDSLEGVSVDKDLVIKTCLLHDMGNIIKFNFDDPSLLDEGDRQKVDELREIRLLYLKKYGQTPDEATIAIIKEITSDARIVEICEGGHWDVNHGNEKDFVWEKKIVCYADMRVGPFGILPIRERFANLVERRPESEEKIMKILEYGLELERSFQRVSRVDLTEIDDQKIDVFDICQRYYGIL